MMVLIDANGRRFISQQTAQALKDSAAVGIKIIGVGGVVFYQG